jgi:uncharacterized protein involved in exopolysaccharide biosynthesis
MRQIEGPVTITQDPDTFDVRGALMTLYRTAVLEWRVILVTCVVVLAVVIAYAILWPPIYQAEASLMSEGDRDAARDSFYGGWSIFRKDDMRTESELFTSAPVLKEVVERENLHYKDIYHPVASHLSYLWASSLVGRGYHKLKDWLSPPEHEPPSPEEQDRARTLADMKAGIFLANVGEANMGQLTVRGPSPRVAQVANTLIHVYLKQRIERYRVESMKSVETLTAATDAAETSMRAIEHERLEFMRKNGLSLGIEKEKLEVTKLADLEERAADVRSKIAGSEASIEQLERQIRSEPATKTISTSFEMNTLRETTRGKRLELQTMLVFARNKYREDSPEVQELVQNMAGLDKIIAETSERVPKASTDALNAAREDLRTRENNMRTDLAGLKASLVAMESRMGQLRSRMSALPSLEVALHDYDREYKFAEEKYLSLDNKRAVAAISIAGLAAMPSIRVVSEAVAPENRYWPKNVILYPAGVLFGVALGLMIALAKTILLGRVRRDQLAAGRGAARFYGLVGVPAEAPRIAIVMPERLAPPKPA